MRTETDARQFADVHRSCAIVGLDQDPPTSFITLFGPVQRT